MPDNDGNGDTSRDFQIKWIENRGNNVIVYTANGLVECVHTGSNIWTPTNAILADPSVDRPEPNPVPDDDTPPTPAPAPPGGSSPDPSGRGIRAVAWMQKYLNKIRYSQGAGRMSTPSSRVGDCSSTVCQALMSVGIPAGKVGLNTYQQITRGQTIYRGSGYPSESIMQLGDLVLYLGSTGRYEHVEMYAGNGKVIGISNKRENGIRYKTWGQYFPYRGQRVITIKRHL